MDFLLQKSHTTTHTIEVRVGWSEQNWKQIKIVMWCQGGISRDEMSQNERRQEKGNVCWWVEIARIYGKEYKVKDGQRWVRG